MERYLNKYEDELTTVINFSSYDGLIDEVCLIVETAYGDRHSQITSKDNFNKLKKDLVELKDEKIRFKNT